jgi:hypothetical protein
MLTYAGIGSRETPEEILSLMEVLATRLARSGWTLRTGGAPGADTAFFDGAFFDHANTIELYLPWDGFNDLRASDLTGKVLIHPSPSKEAFGIAKKYHPAWNRLSIGARLLMARNSHQVLGWDLATPADYIVCWTKNAKLVGGTAQALRIAEAENIPVLNLGDSLTAELFSAMLYV